MRDLKGMKGIDTKLVRGQCKREREDKYYDMYLLPCYLQYAFEWVVVVRRAREESEREI